jgi:hypothetical protein
MMCCTACGAKSEAVIATRGPGARPMRFRLEHKPDCPFEQATRAGTLAAWVEKHGYPIVDPRDRP